MTIITDMIPRGFIKILFITMIIATLCFNTLIIYITASSPTMRTHANLYIQSLSVVDLIVGTIISTSVLTLIMDGALPLSWCLISGYLELAIFATGVFSLLALTYHRYTATFKHQHELIPLSRTIRKLIIVWLAGFLYATRYFLQIEVEKILHVNSYRKETNSTINDEDEEKEIHSCYFFLEERHYDLLFRVTDFVVLFLIPVTLMILMYFRIYKELNKKHFLVTMIKRTARNKRVTKMLVIAVTIFIVCWLPYYLQDIINDAIEIATGSEGERSVHVIVRFVTVILALTNSITNPIIYGWMNTNFRKEIYQRCRRVLTGFGHQNRVEPFKNNASSSKRLDNTKDTYM